MDNIGCYYLTLVFELYGFTSFFEIFYVKYCYYYQKVVLVCMQRTVIGLVSIILLKEGISFLLI